MKNPWLELPETAPYLLTEDARALEASPWTAKKPEHELRFDALPEPFLGDLNAPIVLLNLNPGFQESVLDVHRNPGFAEANRCNAVHAPAEYPFYLLDPKWEGTPGGVWWRKKLRQVIEPCGLRAVARSVLCVEYFPYPSHRFGHAKLRLPSQDYGFHLVRKAMEREALIIRLRSERFWFDAVPELATYEHLHRTKNVQTVSISPRNTPDCFDRVVEIVSSPKGLAA